MTIFGKKAGREHSSRRNVGKQGNRCRRILHERGEMVFYRGPNISKGSYGHVVPIRERLGKERKRMRDDFMGALRYPE
jgi:hypothetical protein